MWNNSERCDSPLQFLAGVEGERLGEITVQTNFFVTTPNFNLAILVYFGDTGRVTFGRIL